MKTDLFEEIVETYINKLGKNPNPQYVSAISLNNQPTSSNRYENWSILQFLEMKLSASTSKLVFWLNYSLVLF